MCVVILHWTQIFVYFCHSQEEVLRDFFKEFILPTTEGAEVRNVPVKIEPVSMYGNSDTKF